MASARHSEQPQVRSEFIALLSSHFLLREIAFNYSIVRNILVHYGKCKCSAGCRNISGSQATNGNNETNQSIQRLITTSFLDGYVVRKVEAMNGRIYLPRFRRNYWLGTRYYYMKFNIFYLFLFNLSGLRCQKYVEYCCGLTCCLNESISNLNGLSLYRKVLGPLNRASVFQFQILVFVFICCCLQN
ncbi:unnamed protein product [Thelazia callipaeda]|uniref:CX domain-containing protein n=1 Tax=Thelazia callipaeda TaxID=103827 RepID=A0A0N5CL09_THECL|nr:unnamed protein product [Thelazia callipaeda]